MFPIFSREKEQAVFAEEREDILLFDRLPGEKGSSGKRLFSCKKVWLALYLEKIMSEETMSASRIAERFVTASSAGMHPCGGT